MILRGGVSLRVLALGLKERVRDVFRGFMEARGGERWGREDLKAGRVCLGTYDPLTQRAHGCSPLPAGGGTTG